MKGLSSDLEIAIQDAIDNLGFAVDIDELNSDELDSLMRSKADGFTHTKGLIFDWQNQQNSPSEKKLHKYISNLLKSISKFFAS